MPIERETIIERSGPFGIIGGIVAALVIVALIIWAVNGGISGGNGAVNVDLPEVTITQ